MEKATWIGVVEGDVFVYERVDEYVNSEKATVGLTTPAAVAVPGLMS